MTSRRSSPTDEAVREQPKFMLRLPDDMRERLKAAAEQNKRSMNAEIVKRLEESLAADSLGTPKGYWELPDGITAEQINEAISEANKRAVSIALTRLGITERPLTAKGSEAKEISGEQGKATGTKKSPAAGKN